jgi:hypothetical protein
VNYFFKVPESNRQKLDAIGLALKGVCICLLGVGCIPVIVIGLPLIILGLFPLYFGMRKLIAARLGIQQCEDEK